ncbi:hypothetical protein HYW94_01785 [Candidatus Uhrbacteria bacterium]|nr:hypothetical protein [Candidatus Uhrbacteria bacterium]
MKKSFNRKILVFSFFVILLGVFAVFQSALAQDVTLQIPLLGISKISGIGEYVITIAKWIVGTLSLLAVIFIMVGGLIWLTAQGSRKHVEFAKKLVTDSLWGLILALGSYMLLAAISPSLVNFEKIHLEEITNIDFTVNQQKFSEEFEKLNIPPGQKTKRVCSNIMRSSHLATYKKIGAELNFPWEILAATHYRECNLENFMGSECGNNQMQFWKSTKFGTGCLQSFEENLRCAITKQIRGEQGMKNIVTDTTDSNLIGRMFVRYNGSKTYAYNDPDHGETGTIGGWIERPDGSKYKMKQTTDSRPGALPVFLALKNNCQ